MEGRVLKLWVHKQQREYYWYYWHWLSPVEGVTNLLPQVPIFCSWQSLVTLFAPREDLLMDDPFPWTRIHQRKILTNGFLCSGVSSSSQALGVLETWSQLGFCSIVFTFWVLGLLPEMCRRIVCSGVPGPLSPIPGVIYTRHLVTQTLWEVGLETLPVS